LRHGHAVSDIGGLGDGRFDEGYGGRHRYFSSFSPSISHAGVNDRLKNQQSVRVFLKRLQNIPIRKPFGRCDADHGSSQGDPAAAGPFSGDFAAAD